jgi:tetratricopeptide (TPR) repeat protein
VQACAQEILKQDAASAEGHFLIGLVAKAAGDARAATGLFQKVLQLDAERYDAAIELAFLYTAIRRNGEAAELVATHEADLANSPLYLNMAGRVYSRLGVPDKAWPLYKKATELQPGIDMFEANLATASVFLGKIDEARAIYLDLLKRHPSHQRNHLALARLETAGDDSHIRQMQEILETNGLPPEKNIFLYYAIGKELEDLERWDEAFDYFQRGGDAVASVADYDVATDIELVDSIIQACTVDWLGATSSPEFPGEKTPIFVVGLPRTGTTLVDRILASHSQVQSADETLFFEWALLRVAGAESEPALTSGLVDRVAAAEANSIRQAYRNMIEYKLGHEPMFTDKLPHNVLYLGFIAKAFPEAKLVCLRRNPMDSCFAMYKQVFASAYRFSYTQDSLARFYVAYDRLIKHWKATLGDRFIEVKYEALVTETEAQTRRLLDTLGLEFEQACVDFHKNASATSTASSVQVREKTHSRSIDRWKKFRPHLQPLQEQLAQAGIVVE